MEITSYNRCFCGAITFETPYGTFSTKQAKKMLPNIDLRRLKAQRRETTCYCDYCANHWGLELCGCGSGELFGQCSNGYEACSRPSQSLEDLGY